VATHAGGAPAQAWPLSGGTPASQGKPSTGPAFGAATLARAARARRAPAHAAHCRGQPPRASAPSTVAYAAAGMVTGRSRYPARYASAAGPLLLSHCAVCAARRRSPFAMRGRLFLFPVCGSGPWLAMSAARRLFFSVGGGGDAPRRPDLPAVHPLLLLLGGGWCGSSEEGGGSGRSGGDAPRGPRRACLLHRRRAAYTGADRREKGRRRGRRAVGPTRVKSSFHMAVNGSRMENPMECRIRNES